VQILYNSLDKSENTDLSVSLANPDLEIFADQNLISQVLINLLKNALEANENNAAAMIKIIASEGNNNHPDICVIDNGTGYSAENIDEIFVPFFTTRQNGSGIGLSISRQIMKAAWR
jgi:two-component system nitrogen regulation sensor histidine kinase NtrY